MNFADRLKQLPSASHLAALQLRGADGQVLAVGKGATQPVESNRTSEGRSENRRVVIIIGPANAVPY